MYRIFASKAPQSSGANHVSERTIDLSCYGSSGNGEQVREADVAEVVRASPIFKASKSNFFRPSLAVTCGI